MQTLYVFVFFVAVIIVVFWLLKRASEPKVRYYETDLRLTYKRFMELYPNSKISYAEYKKLQTRESLQKSCKP